MSKEFRWSNEIVRRRLDYFVMQVFAELNPGESLEPVEYIQAMCRALQDVAEGKCRRLLITVPPRHLKSICASVSFCAWVLGKDPSKEIMVASYSRGLAQEHSGNFRRVIEAPWFKWIFPAFAIDPRTNRQEEIKTTATGGRKAVSNGGTVTGKGADILIVDDLMKADDAHSETERENAIRFYQDTLLSRLNNKATGSVIVIQQRLHEDDLAGRILSDGGFRHVNLPAIAEERQSLPLYGRRVMVREKGALLNPSREDRETLDAARREMGPMTFSAQWQQNPTPPGGNIIRWSWFGEYDEPLERTQYEYVIQSWDTGVTINPRSDPSVCLTWGFHRDEWYLLDVYRKRVEYPDLLKAVKRLQAIWCADKVLIEKASSGIALLQDLRRERRGVFIARKPHNDKQTRMLGQTGKLEAGGFLLPKEAPWLADFKRELEGFPNARHDDQVDALSQFLQHIGAPRGMSFRDCNPVTGRRRIRRRRVRVH